jgi:AcrR family transcriptional regulator
MSVAVALADSAGLAALTMRSLAHALDVKPMSLYHYITKKDEILDAIVDAVFAEIELPNADGLWRDEMRRRAESARSVLVRHPWALALMNARTHPGPATLHHHDTMLRTLRNAGFSLGLTAHAYASIDAFIYGFAIQEATLPFDRAETTAEVTQSIMDEFPTNAYPSMVEFATQHVLQPDYSFGASFNFGLDLILNGLAEALAAQTPT